MNSIITFNPEQSAKKVKIQLENRSQLTVEIVAELYKARDFYSNQGFRSDLTSKSNISKLNTFQEYCSYAGIYRQKANNWLERYIPEENKLLSWDELQEQKKQQKQDDLRKIFEFKKTGKKPNRWEKRHDNLYKQMLDDDEYNKRKQKVFSENNSTQTNKKDEHNEYEENIRKAEEDIRKTTESMKKDEELLNFFKQQHERTLKDEAIKEKVKLDNRDNNAVQEAILEMVSDFIYAGTTIDDRIQRANNVVRFTRDLSVKLTQEKTNSK